MSVDTIRCVGKANIVKSKDKSNLVYRDMLAQFTFLAQFKPKPAVLIGQLPMLAHKVVIHVSALVVHALQKKSVRI
jgi:hypothetical protein